jgi:hypothetical protein
MFRYRRHEDEIIALAVRWYISYRLSLPDWTEILDGRHDGRTGQIIPQRWTQCIDIDNRASCSSDGPCRGEQNCFGIVVPTARS